MRIAALCLVFAGCQMCERYRYTEGVSLPTTPQSVPLDVAWEQVLEIHSGGTWGPVPPHAVHASTDAAACRAIVVPEVKDGDDMRLVVIGTRVGRCDVKLDYADPHEKRWTQTIAIDFTPAPVLPVLAVGAPLPSGPMLFDDARCEMDRLALRCFRKETYGADERFASCKAGTRCSSSRAGPQGFELCTTNGVVIGQVDGGCPPK